RGQERPGGAPKICPAQFPETRNKMETLPPPKLAVLMRLNTLPELSAEMVEEAACVLLPPESAVAVTLFCTSAVGSTEKFPTSLPTSWFKKFERLGKIMSPLTPWKAFSVTSK